MTKQQTLKHNTECRAIGLFLLLVGVLIGSALEIGHYIETERLAGFLPFLVAVFGTISIIAFLDIREVPDELPTDQ